MYITHKKGNLYDHSLAWLHASVNIFYYRWRIVVHGGVDGYTRIPVYLKAGNNNLSDTVLSLFLEATREYGLPSRVRSDKGGENVGVSLFMLQCPERGPGRGSMIVGRSVHNQRIERLWRDVYEGVLYRYYHLFYHLEENGSLDPTNQINLFALHFVYLPRINRHLNIWKGGYVRHRIRTAGSRSPCSFTSLACWEWEEPTWLRLERCTSQEQRYGVFSFAYHIHCQREYSTATNWYGLAFKGLKYFS